MRLKAIVLLTLALAAPSAFGETLESAVVPVPADIMAAAVDFVVTGEGLFIVTMTQRETTHKRSLQFVRFDDYDRPQLISDDPRHLAKTLAGDVLVFGLDVVETYSSVGVFLRSKPIVFLSGVAPLADGSYIAHANGSGRRQAMFRKPPTDSGLRRRAESFSDEPMRFLRDLLEDGEELAGYDVFHVGPEFEIDSGILKLSSSSGPSERGVAPDPVSTLDMRHVRSGPAGHRAVAFKIHRPEVLLIERKDGAWVTREVPVHTKGVPLPKNIAKAMQIELQPGRRFLYQSDVLLRRSSLLVADPTERTIVSVAFDGTVLDRYPTRDVVTKMSLYEGDLFYRTRDGQMIRLGLPPEEN